MKITKSYLQQVIKEELSLCLSEAYKDGIYIGIEDFEKSDREINEIFDSALDEVYKMSDFDSLLKHKEDISKLLKREQIKTFDSGDGSLETKYDKKEEINLDNLKENFLLFNTPNRVMREFDVDYEVVDNFTNVLLEKIVEIFNQKIGN
jgi:hypothetical protein